MSENSSLLSLGEHSLSQIVTYLTIADKLHFSCVCHDLRRVCCKGVRHLLMTQQDLEEYDPLSVFAHATHLHLHEVHLCSDLVSFLIANHQPSFQQLNTIQITNPSSIDSKAIGMLLEACPGLTSLSIHGCWQSGDWQSTMRPSCSIQNLTIQDNSLFTPADLLAWLASPSISTQLSPADLDPASSYRQPPAAQGPTQQLFCHHQQQLRNVSCSSNNNRSGQSGRACSNKLYSLLAREAAAAGQEVHHAAFCTQPSWLYMQELNLSGCSRIGGSWGFLALCPSLRTLNLHSCYKVTNETLQTLAKALQAARDARRSEGNDSNEFSWANTAESAATVASGPADPQADCLNLQQLDISYTRVSDGGMAHLSAALAQLQRLCLKGCNVGDDGLEHLLQLQQLTALHVKHCHRITEDGIQRLSVLSRLQELSYGYTSMPEADQIAAAIAAQFKQLTGLDLLSSELSDIGLTSLGTLQYLEQLKLYQATISCTGLQEFSHQTAGQRLRSLVLYGLGGLTDLKCLGFFDHLEALQLGCLCDLQDVQEALRQLTKIQQLQTLVLERVDGISLQSLRDLLTGCKQLEVLCIRGCDGVSLEQAEQLAADVAAWCGSSASIRWAAAAPCDTDDEDDSDKLLSP